MEHSKYLKCQNFYLTILQIIQLQKIFTIQRRIAIYDQMRYKRLIIVARVVNIQPFLTITDETQYLNTVIPRTLTQQVNLQINKYYRFVFTTQNQIRIEDKSYNICIKIINPIINAKQITEHLTKILIQKQLRMIYNEQKKETQVKEESDQQKQREKKLILTMVSQWCKQVNSFTEIEILERFKHIQSKQILETIYNLCESGHLMNGGSFYEWIAINQQ